MFTYWYWFIRYNRACQCFFLILIDCYNLSVFEFNKFYWTQRQLCIFGYRFMATTANANCLTWLLIYMHLNQSVYRWKCKLKRLKWEVWGLHIKTCSDNIVDNFQRKCCVAHTAKTNRCRFQKAVVRSWFSPCSEWSIIPYQFCAMLAEIIGFF